MANLKQLFDEAASPAMWEFINSLIALTLSRPTSRLFPAQWSSQTCLLKKQVGNELCVGLGRGNHLDVRVWILLDYSGCKGDSNKQRERGERERQTE